MHVKSYCFRNYRYRPPWCQEITGNWLLCSRRDQKQSRWYPGCHLPGRDSPRPGHRTQIKKMTGQRMKGCQGNCWTAALSDWPLSWIPDLLLFPPYKEAGLKGNIRPSVKVHNPPSSQITGLLNKAPIWFNPCLCLLDLAGDRQHKCGFSSFSKTWACDWIWSTIWVKVSDAHTSRGSFKSYCNTHHYWA